MIGVAIVTSNPAPKLIHLPTDNTTATNVAASSNASAGVKLRSNGLDQCPSAFITIGCVLATNGPNTAKNASTPSHASPTAPPAATAYQSPPAARSSAVLSRPSPAPRPPA